MASNLRFPRRITTVHIVGTILFLFFTISLFLSFLPTDGTSSYYASTSEMLKSLYSYSSLEKSSSDNSVRTIPHFHAESFATSPKLCPLHTLELRPIADRGRNLKVIDAIILDSSGNVDDLLEMRIEETKLSVDKYFIVEFNTTRDGRRKRDLMEPKKNDRFAAYRKKIEYRFFPSELTDEFPEQEILDQRQRILDRFIHSHIHELKPDLTLIVLTSTIEQIISRSTIQLLRNCKFPSPGPHKGWLEFTRRYIYSFEFSLPISASITPTAYVRLWKGGSSVLPAQPDEKGRTQWLLQDVGWQCEHCYKKVEDYMLAAPSPSLHGHDHDHSHDHGDEEKEKEKDPSGFNWKQFKSSPAGPATKEDVQKSLCEPGIIDGIANSHKLEGVRRISYGTFLPRVLLDRWTQFRYLLPGGCVRESPEGDEKT
ncbi:glycosyl transferase [Flagelloscypha sp. PMI_526]|nr:glycosyl transferase [Flagelloscypha sp. PMI_526]